MTMVKFQCNPGNRTEQKLSHRNVMLMDVHVCMTNGGTSIDVTLFWYPKKIVLSKNRVYGVDGVYSVKVKKTALFCLFQATEGS